MNRERFIRQRRADWKKLENLLARMSSNNVRNWTGRQIKDLSELYRSVCYDLSLVQSREWGARLERYLNDLVARGHTCLYRSPPKSLYAAVEFLTDGFPRLLRKRKAFFFVSLALFAIPFIVAMVMVTYDPVLAERLGDKRALDESVEVFSTEHYHSVDGQYAGERTGMAGYYVQNNIGIAFQCAAFGVFFGIGSVVTILFNGLILGGNTGYLIHHGCGENFFAFAISHGSFELTAIVVAGAAGLLFGWGIIHPGEHDRITSLKIHGKDAIQLTLGAGFMLLIAAGIEAYFSPMPGIPHVVKYVVGTLLWIVVFCYLAFGGRGSMQKAKRMINANNRRPRRSADEVAA